MSTDLCGIRILEKDESQKRIRLRVFIVYYDVAYKSHEPLPEDHSFFFRILCDSQGSYHERKQVIRSLVSMDQFLDEAWVDRHTWRFIDKVEQIAIRNYPVKNYKKYSDFYYERQGKWDNEEKLVQADYDVFVSDAAYINHLEEGMSWGTTSYGTRACTLHKSYADYLPDLSKAPVVLKPFEGAQEEGTPHELLFSADGRHLFALSQANELVCYDTSSWKEQWRSKEEDLFGYLNQNKNALWLQSHNKVQKAWDRQGKEVSGNFPETVSRLMSAETNYQASFGDDEILHLKDKNGTELYAIAQEGTVEAAAFSADEAYIALGGNYGSVEIWDVKKQQPAGSIPLESGKSVIALSFDPSGTLLAVMPIGEAICVYDWKQREKAMVYHSPKRNFMNPALWSPDNRLFAISHTNASNGYGGFIEIYPVGWKENDAEKQHIHELKAATEAIRQQEKVYMDFLKQLKTDDPKIGELVADLFSNPGLSRTWNELGAELKNEQSLQCYEFASANDPDYYYPYFNRASIYHRAGNYTEAEKLYKLAIEKNPGSASPWINLGNMYGATKRFDECIEAFDHAIRLAPTKHTPYASGSYYAILSGNPDKGFDYASEGIKQGNNTNSYLNKAHVHLIRGQKQEAIDCYKNSMEAFSSKEEFWKDYDADFELMPQYGISMEDYNSLKPLIMKT